MFNLLNVYQMKKIDKREMAEIRLQQEIFKVIKSKK